MLRLHFTIILALNFYQHFYQWSKGPMPSCFALLLPVAATSGVRSRCGCEVAGRCLGGPRSVRRGRQPYPAGETSRSST